MKINSIKDWALEDRPREKMVMKGRDSLSNAELLAILVGTGTRDLTAVDIAKNILADVKNLTQLGRVSLDNLMSYDGIGMAKAITIAAAMELGRRRQLYTEDAKIKVTSSKTAFQLLGPQLNDLHHEEFWIACLNRANIVIGKERISLGGMSATVVDPKIIFECAIRKKASSIILFHNHPSGNLKPSVEDIKLTEKLIEAGRTLDLKVLDHLIVADNNYFSFLDEELI